MFLIFNYIIIISYIPYKSRTFLFLLQKMYAVKGPEPSGSESFITYHHHVFMKPSTAFSTFLFNVFSHHGLDVDKTNTLRLPLYLYCHSKNLQSPLGPKIRSRKSIYVGHIFLQLHPAHCRII